MGATLGDHALVEHDNLVGRHDGGKPVRDHQSGPVARHLIEGILDVAFGVAVERRRGFVEHQDRGRLENGARDGDALLLAA